MYQGNIILSGQNVLCNGHEVKIKREIYVHAYLYLYVWVCLLFAWFIIHFTCVIARLCFVAGKNERLVLFTSQQFYFISKNCVCVECGTMMMIKIEYIGTFMCV